MEVSHKSVTATDARALWDYRGLVAVLLLELKRICGTFP